jgi:hypothetical protein
MKISASSMKTAGFAIAVLLALFYMTKSCRITDEYSVLKGEKMAMEKAMGEASAKAEKLKEQQDKVIAEQNARIEKLLADVGKPTPEEVAMGGTIAAQEREIARLKAKEDYKAALEVAQAEILNWSSKFTLAEERHKQDIFNLNAAWQVKYDAQVVISNTNWDLYFKEHELRLKGDESIKVLEGDLKLSRFWVRAEKVVIVGLGGLAIYSLVRK